MKSISVIGVGKLGLCFSLNLEKVGYRVDGYDINKEYLKNDNYMEENITPFTQRLSQSANNSSTEPIRDSAKRNSALKTALDTGNVTLAEELAQMMSGTHPTQPTPHAPSVGELHLQRMGQDIADATPGISVPADLKDYENLSTKQNPADLIANSPVNVALINTFIEVIRESTHADWKDFLDGVQLMDVTESAGKKWFANQCGSFRPPCCSQTCL